MPVIYNKKVEYAYTDPGVKAHTLSWAEYQALSEDDKMNGDLYFIPDKQPEGNPSRIWTKLGTDPLTTQADDVSGAVNELNASLNNINSDSAKLFRREVYTYSATVSANSELTITATNFGISAIDGYVLLAINRFNTAAQGLVPRQIVPATSGNVMTVVNNTNANITRTITIGLIFVKSDFALLNS